MKCMMRTISQEKDAEGGFGMGISVSGRKFSPYKLDS